MSRTTATICRCLNALGYDMRRAKNVPALSWLGLPLRPIKTIVDVGANRGQFARRALAAFPGAAIHCYEPLPGPYAELKAWAKLHPNIQPHPMALGEASGSARFLHHIDHSPSSSLLPTTAKCNTLFPQTMGQQVVDVTVSTLDDEFPSAPTSEVLLKLDVQGYEDRVLRGGGGFLRQVVDVVIAEYSVASLYEQQAAFIDICQELASAGLAYAGNLDQVHGSNGEVLFLDAVFVRRGTHINDNDLITVRPPSKGVS